jgi:KDO2-lipid IV(A) lauroyltransferase
LLVYRLFRLTIFLMRPLPPWLGYRIAGVVAGICYHFFGRQRRALNENMAHVLGSDDPREVDAVSKAAFRNFGKFVVDFIRFPVITPDEVRRRLVFHQWEELNEVMASKRGMLIVTMHYGNFDLGGAALATYGYPTNPIVENYGYEKMDRLIHESRERLGLKVIPADRARTGIFRALKRGEILALLIDVPPPGQEIMVEFLGAPAEVSAAPARIALRTGAWVVPAIIYRGPESDSIVRPILETRAVRYEATGDEERDVRAMTRQIMAAFEPHVRAHPEQWFIFRPVWPHTSQQAIATLAPEA